MTFGEKLYALRTERKMSQEALARKLGVSRQAVSRWELDEVVPDTANVLAVSRVFGVSTDYLLREDPAEATPVSDGAQLSLQQRQYEVGSGMVWRFAALAGPAVWYLNKDGDESRFLVLFAFGWTLLFGILLSRSMSRVRRLDSKTANTLLRYDAAAVCCICFLPQLLKGLPGQLELLLAELAMVPFLQRSWILLCKLYDLPHKEGKKKR